MGSLKNRVKRLQKRKQAEAQHDIVVLFQAAERGEPVPAEITAALAMAELELTKWREVRSWAH